MIGIIILAQGDMGRGLLNAIEHVLGSRPPALDVQPIDYHESQEALAQKLAKRVADIDQGQGVLILADVYGSSHTNAACRSLRPGSVELVSGVNVPMLLRILSYRRLPLESLIQKALSGGAEGIVRATAAQRAMEGRKS
jgi:PTS system mannose-specific IIA component